MFFRNCVSIIVFLLLLIWGPINHAWPAWLLIRILYLMLIPLIVWLLLNWIWGVWNPDDDLEDVLERALAACVGVALSIFTFLEATATVHVGSTQYVTTAEGTEAVGDDIILPGPDREIVLLLVLATIFVFLFGVLKIHSHWKEEKDFRR